MKRKHLNFGFTLIEVLIALAIIAIAFTALLKATTQDINSTYRIKEKTISHWIAQQGITMVQLGLLNPPLHQTVTQTTKMFNQQWYWRVILKPTPFKSIQEITITTSRKNSGPFQDALIGYRYIV